MLESKQLKLKGNSEKKSINDNDKPEKKSVDEEVVTDLNANKEEADEDDDTAFT